MRERAVVGWGCGGFGGAGFGTAGFGMVGRVTLGVAALVLAGMLVPRVAAAAGAGAGSATPVRAAGAFGVGDGSAARAGDAVAGGESAAVVALRERVGRQGYLMREVRWDPVLRQSWAVLESVGHPERPYVSVLVPLGAKDTLGGGRAGLAAAGPLNSPAALNSAGVSASQPQPFQGPVVRVGDQVTLWSEERNLHVQLTAVADQSGAVGERIRLHMLGVSMGWEQTPQRLTGTVRGAGSVEMTQ